MPNPYAPLQQTLRDIGGNIERGMSSRAAQQNRRQEMLLGHEHSMAGLDLQGRRLGMAEETHGQTTALNALKLREAEEQEEYLNTPTTRMVDPNVLGAASNALFGANKGDEVVQSVIDSLHPESVEVLDDGTFSLTQPNRDWQRWAQKLKASQVL